MVTLKPRREIEDILVQSVVERLRVTAAAHGPNQSVTAAVRLPFFKKPASTETRGFVFDGIPPKHLPTDSKISKLSWDRTYLAYEGECAIKEAALEAFSERWKDLDITKEEDVDYSWIGTHIADLLCQSKIHSLVILNMTSGKEVPRDWKEAAARCVADDAACGDKLQVLVQRAIFELEESEFLDDIIEPLVIHLLDVFVDFIRNPGPPNNVP